MDELFVDRVQKEYKRLLKEGDWRGFIDLYKKTKVWPKISKNDYLKCLRTIVMDEKDDKGSSEFLRFLQEELNVFLSLDDLTGAISYIENLN